MVAEYNQFPPVEADPSKIKKLISVIPYDTHLYIGQRTINSLGKIKPVRFPLAIRTEESQRRLSLAARIHDPLLQGLIGMGNDVSEIRATGSAVTGYAGPQSDLDLVINLSGVEFFNKTSDYYERAVRLNIAALEILRQHVCDLAFKIDVHLAVNSEDENFTKRMIEWAYNRGMV